MSRRRIEVPRFEISPGIWIAGLGLFIRELSALIVADLHMGYEEALEAQGIHLPPVQYKKIRELTEAMLEETGAERLIVLGDVKHEFGSALRQEWSEVLDYFGALKERGVEVHVVRGNHDNFLIPILKRLEVPLHDPYLRMGDYIFVHGHKPLPVEAYSGEGALVVMGHEHPAILLRDELGVKMKFKCFLEGTHEGKRLIVVPSLSPLMPGTELNLTPRDSLLSPVLRAADVDTFRVYVVDMEAGVFDFGPLGALRSLLVA